MQPQIGILGLLVVSIGAEHMKLRHAERDARYASVRINRLGLGLGDCSRFTYKLRFSSLP